MSGLSRGAVVALCAASAAAGATAAAAVFLVRQQQQQLQQQQQQPLQQEEEEGLQETADSCPGPESRTAGLAPGCEGCPGRSLCLAAKGGDAAAAAGAAAAAATRTATATGKQQKSPEIAEKLQGVKKKLVILSGKGGVGKSTVASQLAWALNEEGYSVGLCDLDFCGPSIPLMVSQKNAEIFQSAEGWEPAFVRHDFCVMSIGFLLPEEDSAVIWRGPKKNLLIKTFLGNVRWGDLDFLIIDTPPGTSDEHISLAAMLEADGALVITTPQEAALQDVRKQINFCRKVSLPVLGVVENMAESLFAEGPNRGGAELGPEWRGRLMLLKGGMGVAAGALHAPWVSPLREGSPWIKSFQFAGPFTVHSAAAAAGAGLLQLLGACEGGYSLVEARPDSVAAAALRALSAYVLRCTHIPLPEGDTNQQQQQQKQQKHAQQGQPDGLSYNGRKQQQQQQQRRVQPMLLPLCLRCLRPSEAETLEPLTSKVLAFPLPPQSAAAIAG
ncbi:hypothetical protein Efla_000768 [Eimeria flavescens]